MRGMAKQWWVDGLELNDSVALGSHGHAFAYWMVTVTLFFDRLYWLVAYKVYVVVTVG
jgi:hypothetical protein